MSTSPKKGDDLLQETINGILPGERFAVLFRVAERLERGNRIFLQQNNLNHEQRRLAEGRKKPPQRFEGQSVIPRKPETPRLNNK